jgi:hypothetical protein
MMKREEFDAAYRSKKVTFDLRSGFPAGTNLFYACDSCSDVVPSLPTESLGCSCGNLFVDVEFGRLGAREGDHTISLYEVSK